MPDRLRIDVDGGKYTYVQHEQGGVEVLRYGQPWIAPGEALPGANCWLAMAHELEAWRAAATEFCARVDAGEVRSKRTYAKFKAILLEGADAAG